MNGFLVDLLMFKSLLCAAKRLVFLGGGVFQESCRLMCEFMPPYSF